MKNTALKAQKPLFNGPAIVPKVGQWYINKECLRGESSGYVFAYQVTAVVSSYKSKPARVNVRRVIINRKGEFWEDTVKDAAFTLLPKRAFKLASERTVAVFLL